MLAIIINVFLTDSGSHPSTLLFLQQYSVFLSYEWQESMSWFWYDRLSFIMWLLQKQLVVSLFLGLTALISVNSSIGTLIKWNSNFKKLLTSNLSGHVLNWGRIWKNIAFIRFSFFYPKTLHGLSSLFLDATENNA